MQDSPGKPRSASASTFPPQEYSSEDSAPSSPDPLEMTLRQLRSRSKNPKDANTEEEEEEEEEEGEGGGGEKEDYSYLEQKGYHNFAPGPYMNAAAHRPNYTIMKRPPVNPVLASVQEYMAKSKPLEYTLAKSEVSLNKLEALIDLSKTSGLIERGEEEDAAECVRRAMTIANTLDARALVMRCEKWLAKFREVRADPQLYAQWSSGFGMGGFFGGYARRTGVNANANANAKPSASASASASDNANAKWLFQGYVSEAGSGSDFDEKAQVKAQAKGRDMKGNTKAKQKNLCYYVSKGTQTSPLASPGLGCAKPTEKRIWPQNSSSGVSYRVSTRTPLSKGSKGRNRTRGNPLRRFPARPKPWLVQDMEDVAIATGHRKGSFILEEMEAEQDSPFGPEQREFTFAMDVTERASRVRKTDIFPQQSWEFIADPGQWDWFKAKMKNEPVTLEFLEWERERMIVLVEQRLWMDGDDEMF
ncbi:hypothetical protein P175DRAFT_0524247 [Aspergillus ochraceoroseus IBT 24754]|uniref:Uncharacterized protein n=1 Tax=Aspergillus ochraceoroseus IBT 24754 TaxID=1392256 RepID=A0A2T5LUI3_9EURO|nr:uncharacterized protein P175DRAFT_0524247 [Aspergillus ochraceoroseus IBT 24754]PTU19952.1 hypothetical protein P175DRAFT_0524247 [Aspergillus ochraceoroseus IBT 24754]